MQEALLQILNLNQKKKFYFDYFKEIREIERDLSKNMSTSIFLKLIKNLKDKILRILIKTLINQNTKIENKVAILLNLESTIRFIKEVLKNINKENFFTSIKIDKYCKIKSTNRALTKILKNNLKIIISALKNNSKLIKNMLNKIMLFNC